MQWQTSNDLVEYESALSAMERRVAALIDGSESEMVWLLEHPPLYTAGTSAKTTDLIDASRFPVFEAGRGGQFTYHGPGQRIAYVMLDLKKRAAPASPDIRLFVQKLESWLIDTLAELGIESFTREGRVGVWCIDRTSRECKIAALGIRVKKWVTYHGIALNNTPDLTHYSGIVPCGIAGYGITSLAAMGVDIAMPELDALLQKHFQLTF